MVRVVHYISKNGVKDRADSAGCQSASEHRRKEEEQSPNFQRNKEEFPASLEKLRQLIEEEVHILESSIVDQGLVCEDTTGKEGLLGFAVLSQELTFHLQQLQRQTEQELRNIRTQLFQIEGRQQLLTTELFDLQKRKKQAEQELKRNSCLQTSTLQLSACRELQDSITEHLVQSERLVFQEEALSTLHNLLTQDLQRYQEEREKLTHFAQNILGKPHRADGEETFTNRQSETSMQGKNETENNMSPFMGAERVQKSASMEAPESSKSSPSTPISNSQDGSSIPSINVTPPFKETIQNGVGPVQKGSTTTQITSRINFPVVDGAESRSQTNTGRDSVADSGMGSESELDSNKQLDSPSEEEPSTPKAMIISQNPKYQLYLNNDLKTNGLSGRDADGPGSGGGSIGENGPRMSRWETTRIGANHYKGSLECLASRDWDTMSDRSLTRAQSWMNLKKQMGVIDSPPRVFNSPYSQATSLEYNPPYRMSEKGKLSPATSEMNLYTYNSRSTSPVGIQTPTLISSRPRFSTYDTLRRRTEVVNTVVPTHYSMRSSTLGAPNKKDYIAELTKQLETIQRRNQFLEAESVEMEKERNQIRFEMRGLLVNNEDLLRTNTQLNNELKRLREQMIEMERENQSIGERFREMEIEVKQAREVMVEANTQEYAFNFLEQSLKNRIQDAEENLDKQTQHAQTLAEKLWLAERQLEDVESDKDSKDKKLSDLSNTILRLETELGEAMAVSTQANADMNLQQKLREDAQMRVDELEESLLEKEQEVQKLQILVTKLQGEVSGKLFDRERSLEEEIQLRERLQLQCKQAERTVDDLTMELHSTNQTRDDLTKQLKLAQEKIIDLESDLEELHDSEQRWAAKQKRAIEQTEQLQLKLIQEKDLNEQLEVEKVSMERQLRELRLEVEELRSNRVQEDVISRTEIRVKELENLLRVEERNKATLSNTISKLERKINELSDQMEEEHRIATEQKDLMTQRIRSLKRQLNEAEEEASRKEAQYRHTQRELTEERETTSRLQKQLLDQHLQTKRKETMTIRQTLDNLRLDLSDDDDDLTLENSTNVTKV
ncbi:uncharacterized protein LOC102082328 [Oreochromis niloticus]|uniref:uncharacterized protein LOC102082328 n=1 Tax=Oreochromis niloticus TaxID=8128 RepID=UPI000DF4C985|nr:uncharacterized protein LOC102082328 [Oreochromis niloticus]